MSMTKRVMEDAELKSDIAIGCSSSRPPYKMRIP